MVDSSTAKAVSINMEASNVIDVESKVHRNDAEKKNLSKYVCQISTGKGWCTWLQEEVGSFSNL